MNPRKTDQSKESKVQTLKNVNTRGETGGNEDPPGGPDLSLPTQKPKSK